MNPLQAGIPPNGNDFRRPRLRTYLAPYFDRDDETRHIIWRTFAWREWLRGLLPYHVARWLMACNTARAIHNKQMLGDWWVVPDDYTFDVIHKRLGETDDPLQQYETVGIKFKYNGASL